MVVRDLAKTMESMQNTFGIGPWYVLAYDANSLKDMTYHGKPARFSFKVARTHGRLGGMEIELIEPVEGDSIYSDFLREHGEGVHHLRCYEVESLEALKVTTMALERQGFPCIMTGRTPRAAFAYFETTPVLKTILEVICWVPQ
jgi:methylmalonyl-CoA/ethylmalonyl-CoA epimerase